MSERCRAAPHGEVDGWLAWLETSRPKAIDLGLERVREAAERLGIGPSAQPGGWTVSVAGTNGKGTVVTALDALLRASGLRVGLYTSPHLWCFHERIVVDGVAVDDAALLRAFSAVYASADDLRLTYFEFTTLAAIWLFAESGVDVRVLEVGLGGRLDAVNVWDADLTAITSIALDHEAFLGSDPDAIAREKAGIARAGVPCLLGRAPLPPALFEALAHRGAEVFQLDRDFGWVPDSDGDMPDSDTPRDVPRDLCWQATPARAFAGNPATRDSQRVVVTAAGTAAVDVCGARGDNLAIALGLWRATLRAFGRALPRRIDGAALAIRPRGRQEWRCLRVADVERRVCLDVAHNPAAATELARYVERQGIGRDGALDVVFAAMADKDLPGIVAALRGCSGFASWRWWLLQLDVERAAEPVRLASVLRDAGAGAEIRTGDRAEIVAALFDPQASGSASATAPDPAILVFGSFHTVATFAAGLASCADDRL